MVFFGEYRSKIDKQGRIIIPAKLREQIITSRNRNVYITRGLEMCLFLFSQKTWENQSERLKSLPFTKGDPRAFARLFFSGAYKSKIDNQGRMLIPPNLLEYAEIKERVAIIGVGTRIEIWDEKKWEEYFKKALPLYGEISEKLMEL